MTISTEKGYRKIYIFHSPDSSEVAKGFKKEAKEYSVLEPELIEGEMWKKEHLKKILKINELPRRRLDILMNGMPRAFVVWLYKELNWPEVKCEQNWYYSKAKSYRPSSQGYVSEVEFVDPREKAIEILTKRLVRTNLRLVGNKLFGVNYDSVQDVLNKIE